MLIEQFINVRQPYDASFYRTAAGAEVDLVAKPGRQPLTGYEMKYSLAPKLSNVSEIFRGR